MSNIEAIRAFSEDFDQFQIDRLPLISGLYSKLKDSLKKKGIDDLLMEHVEELKCDIEARILESTDLSERQAHGQIAASHVWVEQNIGGARDMTLIALMLWMDGPNEGSAALIKAANKCEQMRSSIAASSGAINQPDVRQ